MSTTTEIKRQGIENVGGIVLPNLSKYIDLLMDPIVIQAILKQKHGKH